MALKPGWHLKVGEHLAAGDYIQSPNRCFFAIMQTDGNFCVYRGPDPHHQYSCLWEAGVREKPQGKYFAVMQSDGNLAVYRGTGPRDQHEFIWQSGPTGPGGKFYANMQDDGDFVVYQGTGPEDSGPPLWASDARDNPKSGELDRQSHFKYHLSQAEVKSGRQLDLYSQTVENDSPVEQTSTIASSESVTEEQGWANSWGITVGASTEFKVGFPILAEGKVEVSFEGRYEHTWTQSHTRTKTFEFSAPVNCPPRTKMRVTVICQKSRIIVPYTLQDALVTLQSGQAIRVPIDGVYSGDDAHDLRIKYQILEGEGLALPGPKARGKAREIIGPIKNVKVTYS